MTLIGNEEEYLNKSEEKIQNRLKRYTSSKKIIHPKKFFQSWNQSTIDTFYDYCRCQCVLVQLNKTREKIQLTGPINNILQIERKLYYLSVKNVIPREQWKIHRIMISVCQEDKRLAQRLIQEGFSVWAEPIDIYQERNVMSKMDKADCIILCINERSSWSVSSEKEANYAYRTNKLILPVKIQNDLLQNWQREVFRDKCLFQLFGSEYHFDLEFERMLLEIVSSF